MNTLFKSKNHVAIENINSYVDERYSRFTVNEAIGLLEDGYNLIEGRKTRQYWIGYTNASIKISQLDYTKSIDNKSSINFMFEQLVSTKK